MANGFETIGWILTARDMATRPMTKATTFMQKTVNKTTEAFAGFTARVTEDMKQGGPIDKAVGFVKRSFGKVFGSAIIEPMQATTNAAKAMSDKVVGVIENMAQRSSDAINEVFFKERSFAELFKAGGKAAVNFGKTVRGVLGTAVTEARSLVVSVGDVFQKLGGVESVISGVKKMGGIGGAMLGPLGPLLNLFSPLIEMFTRQFTPAIETFSAIVETAFGPFAETLEVIARNIALQLVPIIRPLGAFLELMAVQIGMVVTDMLKGKPEVVFATIFKAMKDAGPILTRVLNVILDMAKQVGGVLLKSFVELAPLAIKVFADMLKALLPIIPPLTKLAVKLLEKVFIPMMKALVKILDEDIIPFIEDWAPAIGILIDDVADSVDDFFSNFGKYTKDFYILFIKPITDYVTGLWKTISGYIKDLPKNLGKLFRLMGVEVEAIMARMGLGGVGTRVRGVFQVLARLVERPIQSIKNVLNDYIIEVTNDVLQWDPPGPGGQIRQILGFGKDYEVPELAKGGLVRSDMGRGILANIGEGRHDELVLPLEKQTVERVLAPLMPELELPPVRVDMPEFEVPGLQELVDLAKEMMTMVRRNGLKVDTGLAMPEAPTPTAGPRADRGHNLDMGVGFAGAGGF